MAVGLVVLALVVTGAPRVFVDAVVVVVLRLGALILASRSSARRLVGLLSAASGRACRADLMVVSRGAGQWKWGSEGTRNKEEKEH